MTCIVADTPAFTILVDALRYRGGSKQTPPEKVK